MRMASGPVVVSTAVSRRGSFFALSSSQNSKQVSFSVVALPMVCMSERLYEFRLYQLCIFSASQRMAIDIGLAAGDVPAFAGP